VIIVSHPTGNAFVRALLETLEKEGRLERFFTTVGPVNIGIPLFKRRAFPIPSARIDASPLRELARLSLARYGSRLTRNETGWASVDAVYRAQDTRVACWLRNTARKPAWAYAYEDGALETFRGARDMGVCRAYELPIAYWETTRRLLREEAQRLPEWEPTLGSTRDSDEKMARKTEELALAEKVICPSQFVMDSVPEPVRARCVVAPFGSPPGITHARPRRTGPLRVLFAGAMTQRKGLADLFQAMKVLRRPDIQLVVMGAPIAPMDFYRHQYDAFLYEAPRSRDRVLALMESCDVLALPSIVEGRALVQQEAMSRGLPLIVTRNAGAEDLVEEGQTGFLVPIRAPEQIAGCLARLADDRPLLVAMSEAARSKAAQYTWQSYAAGISAALQP
jgi:glycosyltransferase involved in cell wall biosynthesis